MPVTLERSDIVEASLRDDFGGQTYDTVIVGAGIAGLTAALNLHRSGKRVLLLEASDRVGGAITSQKEDGYLVERGPNTVLDTHAEVTTLIENVGLTEERIFAPERAKKRFIVRNGVPVALPSSPLSFLRTPLFSSRAKLRLTAEPFISRPDNDSDESVASFTTRRLGPEFLDYAIDPFVSGVYAGRPELLSVRHAFPKLGEVEKKYGSLIVGQIRGARDRKQRSETAKTEARMFSFKEGLERLPKAIADALGSAVKTGCRVTSIVNGRPIWLIQYKDRSGSTAVVSAKTVVYASGLQWAGLLGPLAKDVMALESVEYPPLSVVALGFKTEDVRHPLDGFGLLVPSKENRFVLGALFSSTLFAGRAPKDHVLITAFVGGARSPDNADLSDQRLLAATSSDLKGLLGVENGPVWYDITRWEKAIPQYNLGYGAVKDSMSDIELRHPGLVFAGNVVSGISVAESIKSGIAASDKIEACLLRDPRLNQLEPALI